MFIKFEIMFCTELLFLKKKKYIFKINHFYSINIYIYSIITFCNLFFIINFTSWLLLTDSYQ